MKKLLLILFTFVAMCSGVNAQRHQKAITFNGEDQYMKIPHSDDFNVPSNKSFTVSFWFNAARTIPNPNWQRIICKRDLKPAFGENKTGWELWGLGATWKEFLAVNSPGAAGNHDNSMSVWISKTGELNEWYHVAFVVDRDNNKMKTYFNGTMMVESGSKDISGWETNNTLPIYIGCGYSEKRPAFFFQGKVDDVRFYSKALNETEIINDKDAVSVDSSTDGLIAAYDFEDMNEGDQTVADIMGKHTATLVGYPRPAGLNSITEYNEAGTNSTLVGRGNNQQVARITLAMGKNATIESVKLRLDGTTNYSDISKLNIYKTNRADRFDPRNPGILVAESSSIGAETILSKVGNTSLNQGSVNLWVVADVAQNATEGNDISVKVSSIKMEGEPDYEVTTSVARTSNIVLQRTLIWAPGENNSNNYRIPGIVRLSNGNLVASIDKRKDNQNDLPGNIDVEVKISTDNGLTWGSPITVAQGSSSHGYGDAAMATDGTNIYMLLVGGNGLWHNVASQSIQMYYTKSTDGGHSWSQVQEITDDIKGSLYRYGGFFGSGNGIITSTGKICFVAAMRVDSNHGGKMNNVLVYSDDNGMTWQVSPVARENGDEAKVVELANGDLMISSRNRDGGANARSYVISKDGGMTWSQPKRWPEITGNSCNAAIARYTLTRNGEQKNRLLHTLPADAQRRNLTLFLSEDEGKTWPISRVICKGEAAYSEIVILPNGEIGVISEENDNPAYDIYFTKVSLNWLTKGAETYQKDTKAKCEKPTISPDGGQMSDFPLNITITSLTADAKIYYTTDGTDPTENSTLYTGPFSINDGATIKAIAVKETFANSEITETTYIKRTEWDKPMGTAHADRYVKSLSTSGAEEDIEYTTDFAPTDLVVKVPVEIISKQGQTFTMRIQSTENMKWTHAILFADWNKNFSFDDSGEEVHMEGIDAQGPKDIGNVLYKTGNLTVRDFTITITVPEDAYVGKTRLRLQFNNAWHKKNEYGHSHSAMDDIQEGRIYEIDINITAKAPAIKKVANPIFVTENNGSTYDGPIVVKLSCDTDGAKILYTTDGSTPSLQTAYIYDDTYGLEINETTTIKAIAVKNGFEASDVVESTYKVKGKVEDPMIATDDTEEYTTEITIDIIDMSSGAKIIYTLDGSDPVDNNDALVYDRNNPLTINTTTTVKAMAVKQGMNNSNIVSKRFIINIPSSVEDLAKIGLKVYPTIVKDKITIEYPKTTKARIYSVNGQLLKSFVVDGKTIVDCSELPQGVSILVIDSKCVKLNK